MSPIRRTAYFPGVGRLAEADLRRITRLLAMIEPGTADNPLPTSAMVAIRDAIGSDEAEYFEFRRADRAVLAHAPSHPWTDAPGTEEALAAFGHQNPLGWRRFLPADGPIRLSARMSRRSIERLDFYDAVMRPNGLTDGLKIWLHSDDVSVACLHLWRKGSYFRQMDEDMLGVLHHHLVRLRAEAIGGERAPRSDYGLTRREAEVLTWAIRGDSDEAIAARLGMATATAGKHLEHAFAKLGVHSRTEALWLMTAASRGAGDSVPGSREPVPEVGGRLDA